MEDRMRTSFRALAGALALLVTQVVLAHPLTAQSAGAGGGSAVLPSGCPAAPSDGGSPTAPRAAADSLRPNAAPAGGTIVRIIAAAEAREVRFARQPEIRVRLCGGLDSVRVIERRNLPTPVVVGTTYRDVYIAVEILAHLDGQCLAERITGERTAGSGARGACASIEGRSEAGAGARPPERRP
jgi:hypothetical protein